MTLELVQTIKDAEKEAESLIRDARQKARQRLVDAESEAESIVSEAIAEAKKEAGDIVKKAEAEARSEAEPIAEENSADISRLREEAKSKMPQAVELLTGKVVNLDADH